MTSGDRRNVKSLPPPRGSGDELGSLPPSELGDERLPRSLRLHSSSAIRQIFAKGRKHVGHHLILFCLASTSQKSPLQAAFLTPNRLGNAVKRNRVRRLMREALRKRHTELIPSQQILLLGRTSAVHATCQAVHDDFMRLCQKARLLIPSDP